MIRKLINIGVVFSLLSLAGCYYDNVEDLYPEVKVTSPEDTVAVTYSGIVQPILQANCYECHDKSNASISGSGIFLEKYNDVKSRALDGSLYGAISWAPFYTRMPFEKAKLPETEISKIKKWIEDGAPEN